MPKEGKSSRRHNHVFPVGGFILLVVGIVWLLNELNVFMINIPWIPLVVIVIGLGIVLNYYYRKKN